MERLSAKKEVAIVREYLSGLSYDEIASRSNVAKGTVANVVVKLKAGRFPEAADVGEQVELLRELSIDLKRSNLTPGQCITGLAVLARINEYGLSPADIDRWPLILKSAGSEHEAQEFVRLVYSIQEVQRKTQLSFEDFDNKVHELERKATDLEPMSRQHETCRKELAELTSKRGSLTKEVAGLDQKCNLLNPQVKNLEEREHDLSRRTKELETRAEKAETTLTALRKEKQRLQDTGLPLEALGELSRRLQSIAQRHHITAAELRERLLQELESLGEGLKLESLIQSRQKELEERERAVAVARQEEKSLQAAVATLKQEKVSLEASIKNTREKVGAELAKIVPAARHTINGLTQELRRGHEEALAEVRRLRDESLGVGKEVGRCEEMLKTNQWLGDLLALVRGDEGIKAKQARVITLSVIRGVTLWMKPNRANSVWSYSLSYALENLMKELERWNV